MNSRTVVKKHQQAASSSLPSKNSLQTFPWSQRWFNRQPSTAETSPHVESNSSQDWRSSLAFWLARTINPPVRPQHDILIDLSELRQLPDATLGRELARFLDLHHFDLPQTGDLIQKTHDIWHVLTGLSPSVEDEFILQAFVRAQIFRPSSAIVVLVGLCTGQLGWTSLRRSLYLGRVANNIAQWNMEADWATPLEDVREKLGLHRQGISRQTRRPSGA
ncbi:MAG: hypothetical protein F6K65_40940 [Moorea sp. SIO3C2]|nr:hypothetical protein [Moorena sp. SIO3C2]